MDRRLIGAVLLMTAAGPIHAAGIVNASVTGDTLTADISVGTYEAELTLTFEDAVGLSVDNLGLSARLVDPNDPALAGRLANAAVATGFPVMLVVDPPADSGFSFSGIATIELYTHDLSYDPQVPLRLYSAESGGDFHDITRRVSSGSYRCRGTKGKFSEFLIVLDNRTTVSAIQDKVYALDGLLSGQQAALPSALSNTLGFLLSQAESAAYSGDYAAAMELLEAFSSTVREAADSGQIPHVWRSSEDVTNTAGLLRAGADTLKFSLSLASNSL